MLWFVKIFLMITKCKCECYWICREWCEKARSPLFQAYHHLTWVCHLSNPQSYVSLGNPGFSPFYLPFAKSLYSLTKGRFPVWIISHAGFALTPKDKKILTASEGMSFLTPS